MSHVPIQYCPTTCVCSQMVCAWCPTYQHVTSHINSVPTHVCIFKSVMQFMSQIYKNHVPDIKKLCPRYKGVLSPIKCCADVCVCFLTWCVSHVSRINTSRSHVTVPRHGPTSIMWRCMCVFSEGSCGSCPRYEWVASPIRYCANACVCFQMVRESCPTYEQVTVPCLLCMSQILMSCGAH